MTKKELLALEQALGIKRPRVPAWMRELSVPAKPAEPKDPKDMSAIELLIRTKRRWRLPQWAKDLAAAKGWQLRKRGRPKKKA